MLLLPDQPGARPHLLVTAGKDGTIYLIDRDDLGGYQRCGTGCDDVVQELTIGQCFCTPAYFNNQVYFQGANDVLKAFSLSNGRLVSPPASQSSVPFNYFGATPSISANGSSSGIVWALQAAAQGPAILHAYDALDLSRELYASSQAPADQLDGAVKFAVPTVANGKVYVGTRGSLSVFGLSTQASVTLTVGKTGTGDGTVTSADGRIANPEAANCAETIISANSRKSVSGSMLPIRLSMLLASVTSSRITPMSAMPVRSTCSHGNRPAAMPIYVSTKNRTTMAFCM